MNNFILGSGLIGTLARKILGSSWSFIPFKQSRFYSFEIPLADDFIVYDDNVGDVLRSFFGDFSVIIYKRPFSYGGQLIWEPGGDSHESYLSKMYDDPNHVVGKRMKTVFSVFSYSSLAIHRILLHEFQNEIMNCLGYGELKSIDMKKHLLILSKATIHYDRIISTIPLNCLMKLCGLSCDLKSKDVCYYRIGSASVNLEGAKTVLVSDYSINFFKVYNIRDNEYIFCTFDPIDNPYSFFGSVIGYNHDLIESTRIVESLPIGDVPDLSVLRDGGVECVGSCAQWDDFMDVSSCVNRLTKYG